MTNHPITPPPELVRKFRADAPYGIRDFGVTRELHLINAAYAAGADQELEACCDWLREAKNHGFGYDYGAEMARKLRTARHPKPPSLKEQALDRCDDYIDPDGIIRRALEALPNDH